MVIPNPGRGHERSPVHYDVLRTCFTGSEHTPHPGLTRLKQHWVAGEQPLAGARQPERDDDQDGAATSMAQTTVAAVLRRRGQVAVVLAVPIAELMPEARTRTAGSADVVAGSS